MILAVLDSNALLSGLGWPTAPSRRLVEAILAGRVVPVTTPALLAELEAALASDALGRVFPQDGSTLTALAEISLVIEPRRVVRVAQFDPSNRLLEAAAASGAAYVVTSDAELLRLGIYAGARIVQPDSGRRSIGTTTA